MCSLFIVYVFWNCEGPFDDDKGEGKKANVERKKVEKLKVNTKRQLMERTVSNIVKLSSSSVQIILTSYLYYSFMRLICDDFLLL